MIGVNKKVLKFCYEAQLFRLSLKTLVVLACIDFLILVLEVHTNTIVEDTVFFN